jgi:hypothetical protein
MKIYWKVIIQTLKRHSKGALIYCKSIEIILLKKKIKKLNLFLKYYS